MLHGEPFPEGTVEECVDELDDFVATLGRYSPVTVAIAMRLHLEALLRALLESGQCTIEQARELIRGLDEEVTGAADDRPG